MKIAGFEALALKVPEDDPLANMPEEAGRTRPAVALRLRTDDGIEGIGVTLYGGQMTRALHAAVEELAALTIGEDPMRIEAHRREAAQRRRRGTGRHLHPRPLGDRHGVVGHQGQGARPAAVEAAGRPPRPHPDLRS